MKDKTLNSSLLVSSLLHAALILLASSALSQKGTLPRQDFLPIRLIELPRAEKEITAPKAVAKPPPSKVVKTTDANSARSKTHELKRSVPATAATLPKEEPANRVEAKPVLPNLFEQTPVVPRPLRGKAAVAKLGRQISLAMEICRRSRNGNSRWRRWQRGFGVGKRRRSTGPSGSKIGFANPS